MAYSSAYLNPTLYDIKSVDYSGFQKAGERILTSAVEGVESVNKRREELKKEFKDSYEEYASKTLLDADDVLGKEVIDTMQTNLHSIENFAKMSESEKLRKMKSVQEFNAMNQARNKAMKEIGSYEIDSKDYEDPAMMLIKYQMSGKTDMYKAIPYTDGRIGCDYEVMIDGKPVLIKQNELTMKLNSTRDIAEDMDAINTNVSALGREYQKTVDVHASKGAKYDWNKDFDTYFNTLMTGNSSLDMKMYWRNRVPSQYKGGLGDFEDYPKDATDEQKVQIDNNNKQIEDRLKQYFIDNTLRVTETPLSMTEQQKIYLQQGYDKKTEKFNFLPPDTRNDLKNALDISIRDPYGEKTSKRRSELGFEYEDMQFENGENQENQRVYRTKATSGLIGKQIQTGEGTIFVRDAFILDGKVHITDQSYSPQQGYELKDIFEIPAGSIDNLLVTGSAPTEEIGGTQNDPLNIL